jgi:hypothetical protein
MKTISGSLILIIALVLTAGYGTGCSGKKGNEAATDTMGVADSVVQYFSQERLLKEVTFKDGVRNGLTKTYYPGGQLYQTFWYRNDLREDSSGWYYVEGQLFRSTPYMHDTIDGIVKQYYRTGKIRAKIGYSKGLRTTYFEEFDQNGKVIRNYPEVLVNVTDTYNSNGRYRISLSLSDKSQKVKFYRGEFTEGRFDTARCDIIRTVDGKGVIELRKSSSPKPAYVGVIGEITTLFGNRYLSSKRIDLPYSDLQ